MAQRHLCRREKIAGILIENSILGEMIEYSVVGTGININQKKFSPGISGAVSLGTITGKEYDTGSLFRQVLHFLISDISSCFTETGMQ